jgi:hypothetical protein
MSTRTFTLVVIDEETKATVFDHVFEYDKGKIKFLPATNKIAKAVKDFSAMESEFDPQKPECHKEYCKSYDL